MKKLCDNDGTLICNVNIIFVYVYLMQNNNSFFFSTNSQTVNQYICSKVMILTHTSSAQVALHLCADAVAVKVTRNQIPVPTTNGKFYDI